MKQQNTEFLQSVVGSTTRGKGFAKRRQAEKTMGRELNVAGDSGRRNGGRHVASKNEEKRAG